MYSTLLPRGGADAPGYLQLSHLPQNAILALRRNAGELVVGHEKFAYGFSISVESGYKLAWVTKLEGNIKAITCLSSDDVLIASVSASGQKVDFGILKHPSAPDQKGVTVSSSSPCISLTGTLLSIAATTSNTFVVAVKENMDRATCSVLHIDTRLNRVLSETAVYSNNISLKSDSTSQYLTVTETTSGKFQTISARPDPAGIFRSWNGFNTTPNREETPPSGSCDCQCGHASSNDPKRPGNNGTVTSTPLPEGGTVISDNGGGIAIQPPGSCVSSCKIYLTWVASKLLVFRNFIVAQDRTRRNVAVISISPFSLIEEYRLGSNGTRIATDPKTSKLIALHLGAPATPVRNLSKVIQQREGLHTTVAEALSKFQDVQRPQSISKLELWDINSLLVAKSLENGISFLQPQDPPLNDDTTFEGSTSEIVKTVVNGPLDVLVLPVIEPDQNMDGLFSPAKVGAYLARTLEDVNDYYRENTFNNWHGFNFKIFGYNYAQSIQTPLQLPKHIKEYYFPDFDPASLVLTRSGLNSTDTVSFNGLQTLTVTVTNSPSVATVTSKDLVLPTAAVVWSQDYRDWASPKVVLKTVYTPVLKVTGFSDLNLIIPAEKSFQFDGSIPNFDKDPAKVDLVNYLDERIKAAEQASGITSGKRLFAKPQIYRIRTPPPGFGYLVVAISVMPDFPNAYVTSAATGGLSGAADNFGLQSPLVGSRNALGAAGSLQDYLSTMIKIAQNPSSGQLNLVQILDVKSGGSTTGGTTGGTLTTRYAIAEALAGPGATIVMKSQSGMGTLFTSQTTTANSDTTSNDQNTLRWANSSTDPKLPSGLWSDAVLSAENAWIAVGSPGGSEVVSRKWDSVMILPIPAPVINTAEPNAVQPGEEWKLRNFQTLRGSFRGMASPANLLVGKAYLNSKYSIDFFGQEPWAPSFNKTDTPLICHELGHVLGLPDLYYQAQYRDNNLYYDNWAMMSAHWWQPHHCGYMKRSLGWIPDEENRFATVPMVSDPNAGVVNHEFLLVPIERWDDGMPAQIRAQFPGLSIPIAQLVQIDLGGDGSTYDLVEARQFSDIGFQNYPISTSTNPRGLARYPPTVLVSNCVSLDVDHRLYYEGEDRYRRFSQLLNAKSTELLHYAGDIYDLSKSSGYPVFGTTVRIIDFQDVVTARGTIRAFHINIARTAAPYVDLYFTSAQVEWKNPDLYVDWVGVAHLGANDPDLNVDDQPQNHRVYPPGTPLDQGELVRTPKRAEDAPEKHWIVSRVYNKGNVGAQNINIDYFIVNAGAGDLNYTYMGKSLQPLVIGPAVGGTPASDYALFDWEVPFNMSGHHCLKAVISSSQPQRDSTGVLLGSADVTPYNNFAKKNVDKFEIVHSSPYPDTFFDYVVGNNGPFPETCWLIAQNLPPGLKLTISPSRQTVPPRSDVYFKCKLSLDEPTISAGQKSCPGVDPVFQLVTYRKAGHSAERWSGVEYKVLPRIATKNTLNKNLTAWGYRDQFTVAGKIEPNPGGVGQVALRLAFPGMRPRYVKVNLDKNGEWTWSGDAVDFNRLVVVSGRYQGNGVYSSSETDTATLIHYIVS